MELNFCLGNFELEKKNRMEGVSVIIPSTVCKAGTRAFGLIFK